MCYFLRISEPLSPTLILVVVVLVTVELGILWLEAFDVTVGVEGVAEDALGLGL